MHFMLQFQAPRFRSRLPGGSAQGSMQLPTPLLPLPSVLPVYTTKRLQQGRDRGTALDRLIAPPRRLLYPSLFDSLTNNPFAMPSTPTSPSQVVCPPLEVVLRSGADQKKRALMPIDLDFQFIYLFILQTVLSAFCGNIVLNPGARGNNDDTI